MSKINAANKYSSKEIIEVFRMHVEHIINRTESSVSVSDIEKWLNNFESEDRISALEILDLLCYVPEKEQFLSAESIVSKILDRSGPEDVFYFCPIAKYGKSSTHFTYYFTKSLSFKKLERDGRASFLIHEEDLKKVVFDRNSVVLFYDDFFGSGGSFAKYYNYFLSVISTTFSSVKDVYAGCIYYMQEAYPKILKVNPAIKLIGTVHERTFGEAPMMFYNEFHRLSKKTVAKRYSDDNFLFKTRNKNHSLGYKESEAMLAFPYMPPNNTLPIIWSSNGGWYPLLPRANDAILEKLKSFKQGLMFAATKMQLDLPDDFNLFQGLTQVEFIVFGILRMLDRKVPQPLIARTMGVSTEILDTFMDKINKMGYISDDFVLTEKGQETLVDVMEQVREFKELKLRDTTIRTVKYMPKVIPRK